MIRQNQASQNLRPQLAATPFHRKLSQGQFDRGAYLGH
jgi:hypothetical protein